MPRRNTSGIVGLTEPDIPPIGSSGGDFPNQSQPWFTTGHLFDQWFRNNSGSNEPRVQLFNNRTERGIATVDGRPIVESGMEISPGDTREQTFMYDPNQRYFSIPYQAMDFSPEPRYQESPSGFADPFTAYNRTYYGRGSDFDPFSVGATSRPPGVDHWGFSINSMGEMGNRSRWDFQDPPGIADISSRIDSFNQDPGIRGNFFGDPTVQVNPRGEEAYNPTGNTFEEISSTPYYQPNGSQFDEIPGSVYGEPTVQTPTAGNLDTEPSLFPQEQWWMDDFSGTVSGEVSAGAGGSIWSEAPELSVDGSVDGSAEFSGLPGPIGAEAAGSLPEAPFDPVSPGTGIGPEPTPINQNNEWTTSPEDRRFLDTPEQPDAPTGTVSGLDLRNFGVQGGMNTNMSLGQFLNTSLSSMRYGGGYPPVQGGRVTIGGGSSDFTPSEPGHYVSGPGGDTWVPENIDSSTYPTTGRGTVPTQDDTGDPNNPYGPPGAFNAWPQAGRTEPNAPPGMTIVGRDRQNGQPIYRDQQGNLFVNPGTGSPTLGAAPSEVRFARDSGTGNWQANQTTKEFELAGGYHGNTNYWSPDERTLAASFDQTTGGSLINPSGRGYRFSGNIHDPTGSFARQDWGTFNRNLANWNSGRGGVRGLPAPPANPGGGG